MKKLLLIVLLIFGIESYGCNKYDTINQTICPEDSILFNGVYLKIAGTYYDTFNISVGCDTFRTLNLLVYPTIPITLFIDSFCLDLGYAYNSKVFTIAGIHFDTLNSSKGCDSVIQLFLTYKNRPVVFPPPSFGTIDTFCIRDTIYFQGKPYKYTSGGLKTMRDTAIAANGCDSINLRVVFLRNNSSGFVATKYGCTNVPFTIGDSAFTTNGFKVVVLRNRFGCDSTIWFNLQRRSPSFTTLNRTTCSDNPFFFNGQNWGAGVTKDTLMILLDTLTQTANASGFGTVKCDSFLTLNLTVYPVKYTIIDTALCENNFYFFNGQNRNIAGVYYDTFKTTFFCDSFVTLNLTIRRTSSYTYYRKFCSNESVLFNNINVDKAGTFKDTLVNAVGCDSFLTMVLSKDTVNTIALNSTICSYDSLYFNGQYLKTAGTYTMTLKNKAKCDSVITLNLSVNPFKTITLIRSTLNNLKTDSGFLAYYWFFNDWTQLNASGHTLTANNTGAYYVIAQDSSLCKFKSNVYVYNPAGISTLDDSDLAIYPIPADNLIFVESHNSSLRILNIQIVSLDGRKISSIDPNRTSKQSIDLSKLSNGFYLLKIETNLQTIERRIEKR